jgi:predicted nucleotidyltransferase
MDTQSIINQSVPILKKYGVKKAALFGSVARGDQTESSDIDMLINPPEHISFFRFIDIKLALEESLGKSVDLVDYNDIKPRLKPYILHDEHVFFSQ